MTCQHIVSVSGGKDSTATYLLALEREMDSLNQPEDLDISKAVGLTAQQATLYAALRERAGTIVGVEDLAEAISCLSDHPGQVIRVAICKIRQKLAKAGFSDVLESHYRKGYLLARSAPALTGVDRRRG